MHPILARGRRLLIFLALFAQAGVLLAEILVRTVGVGRVSAWLLAVPIMLVHAFVCLASWYVCRRWPLTEGGLRSALAGQAAAGLLGVAVVLLLAGGWSRVLDAADPAAQAASVVVANATVIGVYGFLLYSLAAAGHYLVLALEDRRAIAQRAIELRLLAREAELRALKAQLDPHFLFNSLNAISALVGRSPERARAMCGGLADFLRLSLRHAQAETIALVDELASLDCYLGIEGIRFGERLRVEREVDPGCVGAAVPPLIVQPLVENALAHGIAHRLDGGVVRLAVTRSGDRLQIDVENPVDADRPPSRGQGFGLDNVRRRLRARYGGRAAVVIEESPTRFRAQIRLPWEPVADAGQTTDRDSARSIVA